MAGEVKKTEHLSPGQRARKRLFKNKPAIVGMVIIVISVLLAVLGYTITPDSTPNANDQILQIENKGPGFSIRMIKRTKNKEMQYTGVFGGESSEPSFFGTMFYGSENPYEMIPVTGYEIVEDSIVAYRYAGEDNTDTVAYHIGDVICALSFNEQAIRRNGDQFILTEVGGGEVEYSLSEMQNLLESEHLANKKYYLGTDKFGRDILSRLIIGVRVSLSVGLVAVAISLLIGITLGSLAGFFRGRFDDVVMWFINVIWSIPTLLLVFAITLLLGRGFWQIFIAVGLTMWVEVARIIRGQVMGLREIQFVEAARSLGFSSFRTIRLHILPNVLGPVMVIAAANFAAAIIIEAGLSFLGIGVQPPTPSWGVMLNENYTYIGSGKTYAAVIPGVAIMIMVLAFNMVGNGFRDALDVKTSLGGK